jgi:hypothetical protein
MMNMPRPASMAKPKEEVPVVEPVVEETTKDEKIVESEETKDEKS